MTRIAHITFNGDFIISTIIIIICCLGKLSIGFRSIFNFNECSNFVLGACDWLRGEVFFVLLTLCQFIDNGVEKLLRQNSLLLSVASLCTSSNICYYGHPCAFQNLLQTHCSHKLFDSRKLRIFTRYSSHLYKFSFWSKFCLLYDFVLCRAEQSRLAGSEIINEMTPHNFSK